MLDMRGHGKEGADDGAPLGKQWRLAKAHRVVFQGIPENLKHKAIGGFNAAVDLGPPKALGTRGHGVQAQLNGLFKSSLLARLDANVGEFEDHGLVQKKAGKTPRYPIPGQSGFTGRSFSSPVISAL